MTNPNASSAKVVQLGRRREKWVPHEKSTIKSRVYLDLLKGSLFGQLASYNERFPSALVKLESSLTIHLIIQKIPFPTPGTIFRAQGEGD
jgi:hypothetical protein